MTNHVGWLERGLKRRGKNSKKKQGTERQRDTLKTEFQITSLWNYFCVSVLAKDEPKEILTIAKSSVYSLYRNFLCITTTHGIMYLQTCNAYSIPQIATIHISIQSIQFILIQLFCVIYRPITWEWRPEQINKLVPGCLE